jgi:hypothetical protein
MERSIESVVVPRIIPHEMICSRCSGSSLGKRTARRRWPEQPIGSSRSDRATMPLELRETLKGRYHDAALWGRRQMQRLGCSSGITQIRPMTAMRRTSFDSLGLLPYGSRGTGSGCRGLHSRPDGSNDSRKLPRHGREWCAGVPPPCRCLGRDERVPLPGRKASIVQLSMVRGLPWQPRPSLSRRFIAILILPPSPHASTTVPGNPRASVHS